MDKKLISFNDKPIKVLCIGAHSDDIEIGCGGTILRLLDENDKVEVYWVVLGSIGQRDKEAEASANKFLQNAKNTHFIVKHFKDTYFPYIGGDIKKYFADLGKEFQPDIIFTHNRYDLHQDHRLVAELTWNTFRNHLILEYEIIKYDGDLGNPNFYVSLDEETCLKKIDIILDTFKTQKHRDWFTHDTFMAMLRIRGVESKSKSKYAEGFYCRKFVV